MPHAPSRPSVWYPFARPSIASRVRHAPWKTSWANGSFCARRAAAAATCLSPRSLREDYALAQRNLSPASFADHFVVESLDIIKIFVQADLGISFVYEAAVQREVQEGTLRVIPLSDAGIFHDISFIYLRDSIYEQDMEDLFEALKV